MSNRQAHPNDVLIVEALSIRGQYPQFAASQVVPVSRLDRLHGKDIEVLWYTDAAYETLQHVAITGCRVGEAHPVKEWHHITDPRETESEVDFDLLGEINKLFAQAPASEFGQGYAEALRDVKALIAKAVAA